MPPTSIYHHPATASTGTFELRQMTARDLAGIATHYLNLDQDARVQRFHTPVDDTAIMNYVSGLDLQRVTVVGAVDLATNAVIGLSELHPIAEAESAEVAISVTLGVRDNLIATQLLHQILDLAALRGMEKLEFYLHADNTWLPELLTSVGAVVDTRREHAVLNWREEIPFLACAAA